MQFLQFGFIAGIIIACDGGDKTPEMNEEFLKDIDGDGYISAEDCNDLDPTIHPNADEVCDGKDNNCDGSTDEGVEQSFFGDADQDGYGNPDLSITGCDAPSGFVDNSDDCDDTNASVYPEATETCDEQDNDCDGTIDEDDAEDAATWYADNDEDGFGDPNNTSSACEQPTGFVVDMTDCDDADDDTFPLAPEVCDGEDNNCDGTTDEGVGLIWYADVDTDGFGDASATMQQCTQPVGYVGNDFDCDDSDGSISPTASE